MWMRDTAKPRSRKSESKTGSFFVNNIFIKTSRSLIYRIWDCPACTAFVSDIGTAMASDNGQAAALALIDAEFCDGFDGEPVTACKTWLEEFVPLGWPVIGDHVVEDGPELCEIVFMLDGCEAERK